ncbi:hypothetical protein C8Q80DRAFT_914797 [Daedaleopsis nitida]|nr:hypothetical protein C8Q80DRAFT_914797 [Daedaleopsis nitida]
MSLQQLSNMDWPPILPPMSAPALSLGTLHVLDTRFLAWLAVCTFATLISANVWSLIMPASATLRRPHYLADTQFEAAHVLGFQPLARHPSTYTLELETVANVGLYIIEGTYRLLMVIIRSIFRVLEVACSCGAVFFSFLVDVVDTLDSAITTVARAIVVTIRGLISICNAIAWCTGRTTTRHSRCCS